MSLFSSNPGSPLSPLTKFRTRTDAPTCDRLRPKISTSVLPCLPRKSRLSARAPYFHFLCLLSSHKTVRSRPTTVAASSAASYLSLPPASPLRTTFSTPLDLSSFVTRQEYQEQGGSNACRRKFGRFYLRSEGKEDVERWVFGGGAGADAAKLGGAVLPPLGMMPPLPPLQGVAYG